MHRENETLAISNTYVVCWRYPKITLLPPTAGDRHGVPDRILAPQRGLDSIGPVLRHWLLVIVVAERLRLFALLRNREEG
jgi:hypothetical protein